MKTLKNIEYSIIELLKWTKFAGMQQLRNILVQTFEDDPTAALAYELSNGTRGTREVAKLAGIKSHNSVAIYWRKWSKMGIVTSSSAYQGRCQHICSLEEVSLVVPSLPQSSGSAKTEVTVETEVDE